MEFAGDAKAVRQHLADVVKNTVVKTTSEIFVIDPMLSHPPQSYIAANPDFWQVKEKWSPPLRRRR